MTAKKRVRRRSLAVSKRRGTGMFSQTRRPRLPIQRDFQTTLGELIKGISEEEKRQLGVLVTKELLRHLRVEESPHLGNQVQIRFFKPDHFVDAICFGQMKDLPNQLAHQANRLLTQWGPEKAIVFLIKASARRHLDHGLKGISSLIRRAQYYLEAADQSVRSRIYYGNN